MDRNRADSERSGRTDRTVILTLALPRTSSDKNGRFNLAQAAAFSHVRGTETLVVTVFPRWIRFLRRLARRPGSPDAVAHDGCDIVAVGGLFWYFHPIVLPIQNWRPRLVSRWLNLACGRQIERAVRERGADLVVAHAALPWGDVAIRLRQSLGLSVVFVEEDGRLLSRTRLARSAPTMRTLCAAVDGTACVGPADVERMKDFGIVRVHHVANGVDAQAVRRAAVVRPERLRSEFVVLWAGHLHPVKGLEVLARACAKVAADADVTLIAVGGDGWVAPRELSDIPRLKIELRPFIEQETLWSLMSWCDVFALPSWKEPWGLVLGEAMAAGSPVIMTTDCGFASTVSPGHNALVVPPREVDPLADALCSLQSDPTLGRDIAGNGEELVGGMTWEENVRGLLKIAGIGPSFA